MERFIYLCVYKYIKKKFYGIIIIFNGIELQVTSEISCKLACEIESEFLCRSFLFKGPPIGSSYNCQLFHLDHKTLPDGPSTYLNAERPLIDDGQRVGTYYENYCESKKINTIKFDNCINIIDNNKIPLEENYQYLRLQLYILLSISKAVGNNIDRAVSLAILDTLLVL